MDKHSLREQIAFLIGDDSEPATFRGKTVTVRKTETFKQREMLSAGFRDGADYEIYLIDENVAGAGAPGVDEDLILSEGTFVITGVRPSAAGAFFTLTIKKSSR